MAQFSRIFPLVPKMKGIIAMLCLLISSERVILVNAVMDPNATEKKHLWGNSDCVAPLTNNGEWGLIGLLRL